MFFNKLFTTLVLSVSRNKKLISKKENNNSQLDLSFNINIFFFISTNLISLVYLWNVLFILTNTVLFIFYLFIYFFHYSEFDKTKKWKMKIKKIIYNLKLEK